MAIQDASWHAPSPLAIPKSRLHIGRLHRWGVVGWQVSKIDKGFFPTKNLKVVPGHTGFHQIIGYNYTTDDSSTKVKDLPIARATFSCEGFRRTITYTTDHKQKYILPYYPHTLQYGDDGFKQPDTNWSEWEWNTEYNCNSRWRWKNGEAQCEYENEESTGKGKMASTSSETTLSSYSHGPAPYTVSYTPYSTSIASTTATNSYTPSSSAWAAASSSSYQDPTAASYEATSSSHQDPAAASYDATNTQAMDEVQFVKVTRKAHTLHKTEYIFKDRKGKLRTTELEDWVEGMYNGEPALMYRDKYICRDKNVFLRRK